MKARASIYCAFFLLSGCARDEMERSPEAIEEHDDMLCRDATLWPGNVVQTCFTTQATSYPNYATVAANVRSYVEESWGRAANVTFDGWAACGANTNGIVQISFNDSLNSDAGAIGYTNGQIKMTLQPARQDFKAVVVHEFGHTLGFRHEFVRADAPLTGSCSHADATANNETTDNNCNYEGTAFDPTSIMVSTGYCQENDHLSPYDILGVQRTYGRKPALSVAGLGGRCLNLASATTTLGSQLQTYQCTGSANDTWARNPAQKELYTHASDNSSRCASVANGVTSPTSGTALTSFTCGSPSPANEQFTFTGVKWKAMGMCVQGGNGSSGSHLALADCGASNTNWDFDFAAGSIKLSGTSLCTNVPNGTASVNNELQLYSCGAPLYGASTFNFSTTGTGEIKYGGLCVNVQDDVPVAGKLVQLYGCSSPEPRNSTFAISGPIHGLNGQCMDVAGNARGDNVGVQVYPCNGGSNQTWDYYFL